MNARFLLLALLTLSPTAAGLLGCRPATGTERPGPVAPHVVAADSIAAGRYLVTIGMCNDCHTPGFMESPVPLPEAQWLTGSPVGFRGPWGTTYPSNLRLFVEETPEDVFVDVLRSRQERPPMPWVNVNRITEADARAIHKFIRWLGPTGTKMPEPVPPGEEPATPYIDFEPKHMERLGAPAPDTEAHP